MRDPDIRRHLLPWIRARHPGALIVEEWGQLWNTRPDVAVFEAHSFHAYEIKSDHDTLARLPRQLAGYGLVFDRITVVAGGQHAQKVAATVPDWVGLLVAESAGLGRGRLVEPRPARRSPLPRRPELALHLREIQALLRAQGLTGTSRWTNLVCYRHMASLRLPEPELLPYVHACLQKRYPQKTARPL